MEELAAQAGVQALIDTNGHWVRKVRLDSRDFDNEKVAPCQMRELDTRCSPDRSLCLCLCLCVSVCLSVSLSLSPFRIHHSLPSLVLVC